MKHLSASKRRRGSGLAALLASVALVASGCTATEATGDGDGASADGPVTIGIAAGFSGVFEPYEGASLTGAEIAVDEINASGGILGRTVELVSADNASDVNNSTTAGQQLLDKGADAVITSIDLNLGGGTASVVAGAGKVAMSIGGGSLQWAKFGPLVYSLGTPVSSDGAVMGQWAKKRSFKNAYLLEDTSTDFGKELCEAFGAEFEKQGGTVLGADTFDNADNSLASQVTRIKGLPTQPDVIGLCSYPPGGALAVKTLRSSGIDASIISGSGMAGDFWFTKTMPDLSDVYTADWASVWGDDPADQVNELVGTFRDSGIDVQNTYGIMGYTAVHALATAMEEAGSTEGAQVADALDQFSGVEVPIPLTFTKGLHLDTQREYRIVGVKDGKPYLDETMKPEDPPSVK